MPTTTAKKKKPKKRHAVNVGDIVAFHSHFAHMSGTVGEVTHTLNQDQVVVRALAPQYEQYSDQSWVVLTYKPRGTLPDGDEKWEHSLFINKIIHHVTAPPTPKAKVKKPAKVVSGLDGLAEALSSGEKHTEVVFVPDSQTP